MVHRHGLAVAALCLALGAPGAPGIARGEDGASPASQADEALQRCWAVKMGMSSEEVSRVLSAYVPGGGPVATPGKDLPCFFKINNFGVYEIQINDHRLTPPHEALFAEALRQGIASWGQPESIDFREDRLRWFAVWARGGKLFWIEQESRFSKDSQNKNGALIHYDIRK